MLLVVFMKKNVDIEWNIKTHDKIAKRYARDHGEIYNEIEQRRLRQKLQDAIFYIKTGSKRKIAFDFGSGAGNLTSHLSELGCNVIAGDVSQEFLDLIASKSYKTIVQTIKLNGIDISNVSDQSVDMVATYSVLHHIPDYLSILKEFMRVLKPGGVAFIDHEPSEGFWTEDPVYAFFQKEIKCNVRQDFSKYFILTNYFDWLVRRFINPKYHREGDIHVFKDDHIEWIKIVDELMILGGSVIHEEDYLLYNKKYDIDIYNKYANIISDYHLLVVRKNG